MADAVEVAIESALIATLETFATANSLTVSVPNVSFTPPANTPSAKYLRATFMPNDSYGLSVDVDGTNQHYGIFQVDVFYGQGGGEPAPARIAASLIAAFERGSTFTRDGFTVQIIKKPTRGMMISDPPWVFIPVRIFYTCYAANAA